MDRAEHGWDAALERLIKRSIWTIDPLSKGTYKVLMRTEHPNASCNVERPVVSLRTVIIAVGAAQFMLPFMLSGAGPLLPAIGRDLHASAMQLSLINAAYTLSLAIFHLVAGRVGDMVGRKRLFLSGLSLFVVMSALLPFVTNIWLFLCCRFVQAMGTAIMNTCALAILVSCAPPEQLGRVLGLTSIGVYSGLSLGPGLSGLLGTALGWQFLFFSVVPIGIIAWLLMYCNVRCDWKDAPDDPFDWRGSLFYTLAVSLLSIGAIWLFSGAWAGVLFALGVVFLGLFLWEERRSHHPILDVAFLVKNKAFALSTLASFINYSSIFGVTFYFSLYLQGVHGLTLLETGLLLSAQPAVQVFISPLGGRMARRGHHRHDRHSGGRRRPAAGLFPRRGVVAVGGHAGPACDRLGHRAVRVSEHQRDHDQCGRSAHGAGFGAGGYGPHARDAVEHGHHFPDHERLSGRRGARPEQYS